MKLHLLVAFTMTACVGVAPGTGADMPGSDSGSGSGSDGSGSGSDGSGSGGGMIAAGRVRISGPNLVDSAGHTVRLTGINWFGLETANYAPHGLWMRSMDAYLDQIVA